jgi:hypothetical protein
MIGGEGLDRIAPVREEHEHRFHPVGVLLKRLHVRQWLRLGREARIWLTSHFLNPEGAVASTYDFAEQLLASQRKFAEDLLTAAAPLMPGRAESASAAETYKPGQVVPATGPSSAHGTPMSKTTSKPGPGSRPAVTTTSIARAVPGNTSRTLQNSTQGSLCSVQSLFLIGANPL